MEATINVFSEKLRLLGEQLKRDLNDKSNSFQIQYSKNEDLHSINKSKARSPNLFYNLIFVVVGIIGLLLLSEIIFKIASVLFIIIGVFLLFKSIRNKPIPSINVENNIKIDFYNSKNKLIKLIDQIENDVKENWNKNIIIIKEKAQDLINNADLTQDVKNSKLNHTYLYKPMIFEDNIQFCIDMNNLNEDSSFENNLLIIFTKWKSSRIDLIELVIREQQEKYLLIL